MKFSPDLNKEITDKATEYLERGWSCFPLSVAQKTPLARWRQYQTEYPMLDEIDDWHAVGAPVCNSDGQVVAHDKYFNLALVTGELSGFVVVDCDNEEAMNVAAKVGFVSPIAVKTSRGMHYYWKHPGNGRRFRNKAGGKPTDTWPNCPGLDFRGDGGYVVAPPSISLNDDGSVKHEYRWVIPSGIDFDDMPTWTGIPDEAEGSTFDINTLDLSSIRVGGSLDVYEQIKSHVAILGRKLRGPDCGDSTDDWTIRFCGQMARRGCNLDELFRATLDLHKEFFDWVGRPTDYERWIKSKVRSAMDMDRRNHPNDYEGGERKKLPDPVATPTGADDILPIITSADYRRILDSLGETEYYIEPIIPARKIVQVVGYNGHGKSFFMSAMLTALATSHKQFGPYFVPKPVKIFYMDFDNPARTVLSRLEKFEIDIFGPDVNSNFNLWSQSAMANSSTAKEMNLRTQEGRDLLERYIKMVQPEIVVIDTVRNGFGGMDEASVQDWFLVNRVAKVIRDEFKASVVLVHHRNKPGETGLGREAGSTAQLTDIDTQVIVTSVYKDKKMAKLKAGLADEELTFFRPGGTPFTPFEYFTQKLANSGMAASKRIDNVVEISYGKLREVTDLHQTSYIAWTKDLSTGQMGIMHTPLPKEDAIRMFATGKKSIRDIAQELFIPAIEIEKWVKS